MWAKKERNSTWDNTLVPVLLAGESYLHSEITLKVSYDYIYVVKNTLINLYLFKRGFINRKKIVCVLFNNSKNGLELLK